MDTLTGKVVVVTGGAEGLGFGLARAFAEQGARLALADVQTDRLADAVAVLTADGVEAIGVTCDVSDRDDVVRLRDATFAEFGTVHVMCSNAGIGANASLLAPIDYERWRRVFDVDYWGVLHGIDVFLPRLLEQGEGHFVHTSSRQGLVAATGLGAYPAAKHAVTALTEMLHMELADAGAPVGVTLLTPGGIRTRMMAEQRARFSDAELADPATRRWIEQRMATAVEPLAVGRLAVRAVVEGRLYVNTHREILDWMRERVDRIASDADGLGTLH
jgi:NAD(P)-dependent dehydrogenase (short-subunit alcohol dehydrogenase family)